MKQWLFFAALALFILACGNSNGSQTAAASGQLAGTEEKPRGEKIYKTYCVACHGIYGDMGQGGAFNLQESRLTKEERVAVITNGRNAMTAFESLLDEKEIEAVAEYTLSLSKRQ